MNSAPRLLIRVGSQPEEEYSLVQEITIVGREAINDLVVNDAEVSRRHCRIMRETEGFMIEDLGSTNGTFVNGQRVTAPMVLYNGDTIELGKTVKLVFLGGPAPQQASVPPQQSYAPPSEPSQQQYAPPPTYPEDAPPYTGPAPTQQQPQAQYSQQQGGGYESPAYGRPPEPMPDDAPDYYVRPDDDPYPEYDDEDDGPRLQGCQRWAITCGCLLLLGIFLLGATFFFLDAVAPDALYCGPLRGFWETVLGPILEAFGRPLSCATP